FSSRRRHTRSKRDWSSDVCSSDLVTDKELKNSKEQLKGQMMLSLENTSSRMMRNGRNELLLGKHRSLDDIITDLNSVTHDSVKQVSNQLFTNKPATALIAP